MSGNRGKGRPKGALNKATKDIKELARAHGPEVIEGFWRLFKEAHSDAARIAAGKDILARGYGKATQPIAGDGDGGPIAVVNEILLRGVRSNQDH